MLCAPATSRADAPGLAIVVEDGGAAAAEQLARIVDAPTRRAANAAAGCAVAPVVVVIGAADGIAALRCADRVRLSRSVETIAVAQSPYAAALVAAELLDLLHLAPRAVQPEAPRGLAVGVHLQLAALGVTSVDGSALVLAPRAGIDLVLGRRGDRLWVAVGLYAAPFGLRTYGVSGPDAHDVSYGHHEVGARVLLGHGRLGAASVAVGLEGGCTLTLLEARTADGSVLGSDTRARGFVGLAGELRQPLAAGIGVMVGVGFVVSPDPWRWLVHGVPVVTDGIVWVRAFLGLTWDA